VIVRLTIVPGASAFAYITANASTVPPAATEGGAASMSAVKCHRRSRLRMRAARRAQRESHRSE
jgi:hypothetical protein